MLGRIASRLFLSLFMDKKARKRLEQTRKARPKGRAAEVAALQETTAKVMTPERQQLIRQAMEVRRAKSKILDDLDDEQKRKLYAMAIKTFLNKAPEDDGNKKK